MRKSPLRQALTGGLVILALTLGAVPTAYAVSPVEDDFAARVSAFWADFTTWVASTLGLPSDDEEASGTPPEGGVNQTNGGGDQGDSGPSLDPSDG